MKPQYTYVQSYRLAIKDNIFGKLNKQLKCQIPSVGYFSLFNKLIDCIDGILRQPGSGFAPRIYLRIHLSGNPKQYEAAK